MVSKQLTRLLSQLRGAENQLEQLKVLVRGWRELRALETNERKRLALNLGWDSAEVLLDKLGERGGIAPSHLLKAVRNAERDRPGELAALLADLKTSEGRQTALREGLRVAEQVIDSLDSSPTAETPELPPPPSPHKTPDEVQPAAPVQPADAPEETEPKAAEEEPARDEPEKIEPEKDLRQETQAPPATTAAGGAAGPPPQEKLTPLRAKPEVPDLWAALSESSYRPAAVGLVPSGLELPAQVVAPPSEGGWLRKLYELRRACKSAEQQDPVSMLSQFPDGWLKRRALIAWLQSEQAQDPAAAIEQIAGLSRSHDRFWCASVWLEGRERPAEDVERLEPHLPPHWMRRLRRRFNRPPRSVSE